MAASRKLRSVEPALLAPLRGKRLAVGLSGGVDSVVLLHVLHGLAPQYGYRLSAVHVNHGISPNAVGWAKFCSVFCSDLGIPLKVFKVKITKGTSGLEAAARAARRAALEKSPADAIALAHHLDDQAETVLLNLLRGAGIEGASGMAPVGRLGEKLLVRPLLGVTRADITSYAAEHRLGWVEDESNTDTALTRNFLRHRVGPLLEQRFPRWREALARAARHFAGARLDERKLLRAYLKGKGLRTPSEAKLVEMLKQFAGSAATMSHEGTVFRLYRGKIFSDKGRPAEPVFKPLTWSGESRLGLPELGGELRFRKARGQGIDRRLVKRGGFEVRLRSGGERLRPDAARPRRTLKNLFQEAGVPPWERERLPLLYYRDRLVWVPGLGVDAEFQPAGQSAGVVAEWRRTGTVIRSPALRAAESTAAA